MRNHAVEGLAFRCRHLPLLCGCSDEHAAGSGTRLAQVLLGFANASAAAGGHVFPNLVTLHVLVDIGVLGPHFGPIALQFFGHQHGQAGHRALSQFGAGDADDDTVVGLNHHPMRDLGHSLPTCCQRRGGLEAQDQGTREGRGLLQKLAAVWSLHCVGHEFLQNGRWVKLTDKSKTS